MARTALSLDTVIAGAESMIDEHGWRQMSVSVLARQLGVQGPSLYHHVGGLTDLRAEVQVRSVNDLGARVQRAAVGKVGADCFHALARALDDFASEHPGLCELALSEPVDPPRVHAASEAMRTVLSATIESFGATATMDLQVMCLAPLHGVLGLTRNGAITRPGQHDRIYRRMTDLVIQMLESEGND